MRVRHRIPSIFNLSMVDVLCCALGCVILLWLINLREAKEEQDTAAERSDQLGAQLASAEADRKSVYQQLSRLQSQIKTLQSEQTRLQAQLVEEQDAERELQKRWKAAQALASSLDEDLKASQKQSADLRGQLRLAVAERDRLGEKLKGAEGRVAALQEDLAASTKKQDTQMARARGLVGELEAANARIKELQAKADLVPGLKDDLKAARAQYDSEHALAAALEREIGRKKDSLSAADKAIERLQGESKDLERELALARGYRKKWADSEERLAALQKELAEAQQGMVTLESQKKDLQAQALRVRNEAANRFAGIALTGRRVVFLVDMSGSMELIDQKTPAPNKWSDVANTVARLMRSMPVLEKYQVIVFAEKASFLLGEDNTWLTYDPRSSPDEVVRSLSKLRPKGGTNLYSALYTAFGMRSRGMDTIYLLSDGLPNMGVGMTEEEARTVRTEEERSNLLASYLRKTLRREWNRADDDNRRVRINTIGFFFESPEIGAFLWALARENEGSFVGMSKP